jgi:hypothetical protein
LLRRLRWALVIALALAALGTGARAELAQQGNLRIHFDGQIAPKRLPRHGRAPVTVVLSAQISTTDGTQPPQLRQIVLDINRHGTLLNRGLPRCRRPQLAYATSKAALRACGAALVGHGHVSAKIALPEQAPLPSEGQLLAFNGRKAGRPVIFAHIYGARPLPITFVLGFEIDRRGGRFGTRLRAALPQLASGWGYVSAIRMTLGRRFWAGGRRRSYLSAGCPAPHGFPGALFTLARATYSFDDGRRLSSGLVRSCRVRRARTG